MCKPKGFWTKDRCINESKLFATKKDFRENSPSAYAYCCRNGWLDELDLISDKVPNNYWTEETFKDIFYKYEKISEFRKNNRYLYKKAIKNEWLVR